MKFKQTVLLLIAINLFLVALMLYRNNHPNDASPYNQRSLFSQQNLLKGKQKLIAWGAFSPAEATIVTQIQGRVFSGQTQMSDVDNLLSLLKGHSPTQKHDIEDVRQIVCLGTLTAFLPKHPLSQSQKENLSSTVDGVFQQEKQKSAAVLMMALICAPYTENQECVAAALPLLDHPNEKVRKLAHRYIEKSPTGEKTR